MIYGTFSFIEILYIFRSVLLCTFYKPNISNQFLYRLRIYRAHISVYEKKIFFFIFAQKAFPIYRECVSQTMLHISHEISSITLNLSQHVNFQYFCFCEIYSSLRKWYHGYELFYIHYWWHIRDGIKR